MIMIIFNVKFFLDLLFFVNCNELIYLKLWYRIFGDFMKFFLVNIVVDIILFVKYKNDF